MAEEARAFDFGDVVHSITAKLLRRHPHVFGNRGSLPMAAVNEIWDRIKAEEKRERAARRGRAGTEQAKALAGVPSGLPALTRALKLQENAAKLGFDWDDPLAVLAKIREEADEVEQALARGAGADVDRHRAAAEVGDLLFATVNLARHLRADPETALRATNVKFERRFAAIERTLAARGQSVGQATLAELDALWEAAKAAETGGNE